MTARRILRMLLLMALWVLIIPSFAQDSNEEEVMIGTAYINDVAIVIDANAENPVMLNVSGEVGDPCTQIAGISQENDDDIITITITTERPVNLMCAAVVESFEAEIALDLTGLRTGTYTLFVNDYEDTIVLPASLIPESTPEPQATEEFVAETVAECPEATEETSLIETDSYCFLYPADAMTIANDFLALINTPMIESENVRASLLLDIRPSNALVLVNAIANLGDDYFSLPLEFVTFNSLEALTTELDDNNGSQVAFILGGGNLYIFTGTPNSPDLPEASTELDTLWQTILSSFVLK